MSHPDPAAPSPAQPPPAQPPPAQPPPVEPPAAAPPAGTRHVEVRDSGRVVGAVDVEVHDDDPWTVQADLHPRPGLPPEAVPPAVDAVVAIPEVAAEGGHLRAGVPVGAADALARVRAHADEVRTHLAGSTSIVDADLPPRD